MKLLSGVLSILMIVSLSMVYRPTFAADDAAQVVYHADFSDPRRFSAMLTSINNMVVHYENELLEHDIRIVFVSHGIRFLTDDKLTGTPFASNKALEESRVNLRGRLSTLNNVHGVKLELCDITRSEIELSSDALYKGVETVPSGVVRIAELQNEGFSYIKIE